MSKRISATLSPRAAQALEALKQATGKDNGDLIGQALMLQAMAYSIQDSGKELWIRDRNGRVERLHVL